MAWGNSSVGLEIVSIDIDETRAWTGGVPVRASSVVTRVVLPLFFFVRNIENLANAMAVVARSSLRRISHLQGI